MTRELNRMEKAGRYFYTHPAVAMLTIGAALVILAGAIAVTFFRGESTRNIVTRSACKIDPRGDECQAIFTASIKAFDHHTACVLAQKLLRVLNQPVPCKPPPQKNPPTKGEHHARSTTPSVSRQEPAGGSPDSGTTEPSPGDSSDPGTGGSDSSESPPTGDGGGEPTPTTPETPETPGNHPEPGPSGVEGIQQGVGEVEQGAGHIVQGTQQTVHDTCTAVNQLGLPVKVPC